MPERTRPIRKEICLNETEWNIILQKMQQLMTRNFGAYARKMLIDGYIIQVDYTEQKKLAAAVSRIAANINHICRRINQTGHFYEDDVTELKERVGEVWELLKQYQKEELRLLQGPPSPGFQTAEILTLQSDPFLDFWTAAF